MKPSNWDPNKALDRIFALKNDEKINERECLKQEWKRRAYWRNFYKARRKDKYLKKKELQHLSTNFQRSNSQPTHIQGLLKGIF